MATRNRRTQNVSCKPNWLLTKLFYCHRSSVFNLIRFIDLCPHPLKQILSYHVVILRAKDAPGSTEHTFATRWSHRNPEVLSCHSGETSCLGHHCRTSPSMSASGNSKYCSTSDLIGTSGASASAGVGSSQVAAACMTHECCERAEAWATEAVLVQVRGFVGRLAVESPVPETNTFK